MNARDIDNVNKMFKGLKFLSTNADSLRNKMLELEAIAEELDPDVICITELKHTHNEEEWSPVLENYSCFCNKKDLGVCMFVKSSLNFIRNEDLEKCFSPSVFGVINIGSEKISVGVLYRSPNSNEEENEKVNLCISTFFEQENSILTGDFNHPEINWNDETCPKGKAHPDKKFLETIQDNFILQLIEEPTHRRTLEQRANILDLILVRKENFVTNIKHLAPLGKSHHDIITFECQVDLQEKPNPTGKKFLMDKGDYDSIRKDVDDIDWADKLKDRNVDESWEFISDKLIELKDKYIPCKKFFSQNKTKKTIPFSVLEKI